MHLVGGADGCRGGWFLATKNLTSGRISFQIYPSAYDLFDKTRSLDVLALDIPIGLKEKGPRKCDLLARRLLKAGRASSVFPAPVRPVLSSNTYQQACQTRFEIEGKRMSLQAWALVEKIRTVDAILRTDTRIRYKTSEVHPELSFFYIAGEKPCRYSKKCGVGRDERRNLLTPFFSDALESALAESSRLSCAADDILDAFAALWTAERIAERCARTIPAEPEIDAYGLRMAIVA